MRFLDVALVPLLLASALAQEKKSSLPDAPGREAVERVCSNCHELETVTAARRTRIGWQRMVEDMAARGAEGSDEDLAAIVSYLTATFGKVNVNTASAGELEKTLGLSADEAKAIVDYREKNGKIGDFEQLAKVPGLNAEKLRPKRPLIAFAL
jgi:competence ComEA-like helix-hairpin-helix protein